MLLRWGLLFGLCCATTAHAQAPAVVAEPRDYALEFSLGGHFGAQLNQHATDTALLGVSALARASVLEAGAQLNAVFFSEVSVLSPAVLAGLGWQSERGLRVDLLGILGADYYEALEYGANGPVASATLGFYGVRAGFGYRFAPRYDGHVIVGLLASYERDFERVTHRYSYSEANHTFGERRLTLALYLAISLDLLPA